MEETRRGFCHRAKLTAFPKSKADRDSRRKVASLEILVDREKTPNGEVEEPFFLDFQFCVFRFLFCYIVAKELPPPLLSRPLPLVSPQGVQHLRGAACEVVASTATSSPVRTGGDTESTNATPDVAGAATSELSHEIREYCRHRMDSAGRDLAVR